MHYLTCLVKASNLSYSQLIWKKWPITTAVRAQIKMRLRAMRKSGCLLNRLSCCMWCVCPLPSCETIAWSRMWSRPEVGQTLAGTSPLAVAISLPQAAAWLSPGPRIVQAAAISRAIRLLSPKMLQAASRGLFSVSSKGCVQRRGTNLAGLGSTREGQNIQPGAKAQLNLAVFQASEPPC